MSAATGPLTQQRKPSIRRPLLERAAAVGFLLPTLVAIAVFCYYPAIRAGYTSFTSWDGFNPPEWVGLDNFTSLFADEDFRQSAINVGIWTLFGVPLAMVPSFIIAELIFRLRSERLQYVWRAIFTAPLIIPPVVSVLIWQSLYGPEGPINSVLRSIGLDSWTRSWIADPKFALFALIFMGFPWISAFNVLIFYSGLKAIPREVLEASALDGAGRLKQFFRVEIPLTFGQWKLLLVLSIIGVTQNLMVPLLLTGGGPGNATLTPVLYMYQGAITYGNYGFGMAVGTVLFVVVLALSIINMRVLRTDS